MLAQLLFEKRTTCSYPFTTLVEHSEEWKKGIPMEKLAFALITIAHKLKPYFQVSSAPNSGSNRQTYEEDNEKSKGSWMIGFMGY